MEFVAPTLGILVIARVAMDFMSIKKTSNVMHAAYVALFLIAGLVILLAPETSADDAVWGWLCVAISAAWCVYLCLWKTNLLRKVKKES
jgi:hypothetical protein